MQLAVVALVTGCAGPPPEAPAANAANDPVRAKATIAAALDDLHDAAAHADEPRYFAHFAPDAVFLGTDATERWDTAAFRAYAHPHFAAGKAWRFHALRRAITLSDDGRIAWFDEDLETERLGPARGSGVLVSRGGVWKLEQYNLAITIPNDRFESVRDLLRKPPEPPKPSFEDRYQEAREKAVAAVTAGSIAGAEQALTPLLEEADRVADITVLGVYSDVKWLRWAEGDLASALRQLEAEEAASTRVGLMGNMSRKTWLGQLWERAYFLRELAATAPPTLRTAALAAAIQARDCYLKEAPSLGDDAGIHSLAAYFALRDGKQKKRAPRLRSRSRTTRSSPRSSSSW